MKCAQCGYEARDDAAFCGGCGSRFTVAAPQAAPYPSEAYPLGGGAPYPIGGNMPYPSGANTPYPPQEFAQPPYGYGQSRSYSIGGQIAFSIVNIVLGQIGCIAYGLGLIPMIFGIIALVKTCRSPSIARPTLRADKLKSAREINFIAMLINCVVLVVSVITVSALIQNGLPG